MNDHKAEFLILLLTVTACATVPQVPLDAKRAYRMDLSLKVNGKSGSGVLVVEPALRYEIEARAKGDPQVLMLSTCHRETVLENQDRTFKTVYSPSGVEFDGYCPMRVEAFSDRFKYQAALVDVKTEAEQLPVILHCNGVIETATGVTVCQSRAGLLQRLDFPDEVTGLASRGCAEPVLTGTRAEITLSVGSCVYSFKSKKSGQLHRLTTYGYEEVLLAK